MVTGRSVTAILHFLNQTPMDWYSKKQATVETATFGSEFIATRTTTSKRLFIVSAFLFEIRATSLETTRPLSMPHQTHMPSYTRDTMLYHSIMYKRQSLPSMLQSSICWANTTLPTSSASTGLMLWYGEP
jgi:hypothetical protein